MAKKNKKFKKVLKRLHKCTNIRIESIRRDMSDLQNQIDILLSGDKGRIATLYAGRKVMRELANQIFKGDGKNKDEQKG